MTSKQYESYEIEDFFCNQENDCSSLVSSKVKQGNSTYDSLKCKKLLKNRISAQNSRIKKKLYIDSLERSERELIRQIQETEKEIEKTNQELNSFLIKNKENDSFNHDEKPTYERLKSLIRDGDIFDEDEAIMLIELLINRIGVTGKERRRMTDYYSKRLVNFSIPAIYRYLLHASTQDNGLLAEENTPIYTWDSEFYQKVILNRDQKIALLNSREKIAQQKQTWIQKIQAFEQIRADIYKTSCHVQENLLEMRWMLNTRQMGEIIVRIQNRKYNRDLALGERQFQRGVREEIMVESGRLRERKEEKEEGKKKKGNNQSIEVKLEEAIQKSFPTKKVKVQEEI